MGTPYLGRGGWLGFGVEGTWGTAVATTNWMRMVSASAQREVERVYRPHLGTPSAVSAMHRSVYDKSDFSGGSFEVEWGYSDSSNLLLSQAFGAAANGGGGPFTHTYTLADALPIGLTIDRVLGNGKSNMFEGCVIDGLDLSCNVGEVARMKVDFLAQTASARQAGEAPTMTPSDYPVLHHHAGAAPLEFNAVNYDVLSWGLSLKRGLTRRQLWGSKVTAKPVRAGFEEVVFRITKEYDSDTLHDAYISGTADDMVLTLADAPRAAVITIHNAVIRNYKCDVNAPGPLQESMEFVGLSDGTDEGAKIIVTNAVALYTSNG
jgi:hypothetical protein